MATEITFETYGLKELQDKLNRAPEAVVRVALNEGLRRIGNLIVPAKGTGPLANETPKVSGKGARSTHYRIGGDPRSQRLEVLQPAMTEGGKYYLEFVREGTKPHDIKPVKAKALRFWIEGNTIFAQLVHHPGSLPNPYHKRVLARLHGNIQQIVNDMGRKVTAYLAGR